MANQWKQLAFAMNRGDRRFIDINPNYHRIIEGTGDLLYGAKLSFRIFPGTLPLIANSAGMKITTQPVQEYAFSAGLWVCHEGTGNRVILRQQWELGIQGNPATKKKPANTQIGRFAYR